MDMLKDTNQRIEYQVLTKKFEILTSLNKRIIVTEVERIKKQIDKYRKCVEDVIKSAAQLAYSLRKRAP